MKLPILYHNGKGALVQWEIWTKDNIVYVRHGQVGGKLQLTPGIECVGKNIGKTNETSPSEQAIVEAKAMWTFKVERKYSETKEDAQEEVFLPMLAHSFKKLTPKAKSNIRYPVDVQPKLDGVRAMAFWGDDNRVVLFTRGGKEWISPKHIIKELEAVMPKEMVLDGELYIHGVDFESLTSWAKKIHPETINLEYHIFDMPINAMGGQQKWSHRSSNLEFFFRTNYKYLIKVPVKRANSEKEILELEEFFVEEGYEGSIVRTLDGEYVFGHRSKDLLKVKSAEDAEFKIIGFDHGVGKFNKSVIWICETKDGKPFKVTPKTTKNNRERLYREGKSHVGKWLKVRFQNYTVEGKPRFGRSLGFRDPIDMD